MAQGACGTPSPPPLNIPFNAFAAEEERRPEACETEDHAVSFSPPISDAGGDIQSDAEPASKSEVPNAQCDERRRRKTRKKAERQPPFVLAVVKDRRAADDEEEEGAGHLDPHGGKDKAAHSVTLSFFNTDAGSLSQAVDVQLLRVVAEALLQAASAGHNAESSSGTESESEPSRPPTAVTPRPRLESSLQATRSAPPLSISPSQVGTERGTASTMTIKETLFDIDGGCPPHTVTSQSDAVDPSRPLPATAAFYADDADGTQAIPNCGAMPPYEQSFAENAGTVQAASAPSDEVENAEEDAETRASHMSDCIWWLDASHPISRFFEVASMIVILVSIFTFVLETIPRYRLEPNGEERSDTHPDFVALEIFCIGWFTVEYLMRMYAAKGWRLKWARQPLNVIDLLAIVPYYVSLGLSNGAVGSAFVIVRILRLMRVTRLFKFSRHSQALRDMIFCITQTRDELLLFFFIISVASVLFGSAVFYCEKDAENTLFISIPESMWWAVITMTTVGYGDVSPETIQGKIVGVLCASLGVVLLAVPAGIFISEFMRIHEARKREETIRVKHDVVYSHVSDLLEEAQKALAEYRQSRQHYEAKLKAFYEDQLQLNATASLSANATTARLTSGLPSPRLKLKRPRPHEIDEMTL